MNISAIPFCVQQKQTVFNPTGPKCFAALKWVSCNCTWEYVLGCALLLAQEYQARFESCFKLYSFHFWETPDLSQPLLPAALARTQSSSSSRREVAHYGSWPYQALYEGYFLEPAAAKAYLALFQASHKAPPYSKDILRVNSDHLADLVSSNRVCCRCCCCYRCCCCPPSACLGSRPPRMKP